MNSERCATTSEKRAPLYYGWAIVGIAALGSFLSGPGQTFSVSTLIDPIMAEFGWSRSLVSSLYSGGTLAAGFVMILVGRLVDQQGYRRMLTLIAVLFGLALFFMSTVNTPAALFVGFLLIRVFGQGSLTLIPYSMVPQWFVRRRGMALSFLAIALALSSAALPSVNLSILEVWGWRATWQFWGVVLLAVLAPIAWLWTRETPEEMGLCLDGFQTSRNKRGEPEAADSDGAAHEEAWTLKEAMGTSTFWFLLFVISIPPLVSTGATFHHISILVGNGVDPGVAALAFTSAAAANMAVTFGAGYAVDRWPVQPLLAAALLINMLSLVWLLWSTSVGMVVLLGFVRGVGAALLSVLQGATWPHFFGRRHLGSIRGAATTAMVVFSALGPMPFGLAYDWFGGYTEVILGVAILPLAGGLISLWLPNPTKEKTLATAKRA